MLHDAGRFQKLRQALADCRRQRSFEPCRAFCDELLPVVRDFAERYHLGSEQTLLAAVAEGLPYDRGYWRSLVGELLLCGADEVPELQTAPDTLCRLLAPECWRNETLPREQYPPILQAHFGARDLVLGGFYRPEAAGLNNAEQVARLSAYLAAFDPERWTTVALRVCPELTDEEERVEELEFARQCFLELQEMYQAAALKGQVVVCETIHTPR